MCYYLQDSDSVCALPDAPEVAWRFGSDSQVNCRKEMLSTLINLELEFAYASVCVFPDELIFEACACSN